jgi:hypothetical protein
VESIIALVAGMKHTLRSSGKGETSISLIYWITIKAMACHRYLGVEVGVVLTEFCDSDKILSRKVTGLQQGSQTQISPRTGRYRDRW